MTHVARFLFVPGIILVLGFGAGCKRRVTAPPATIMPVATTRDDGGWPLYEKPAEGFAVALPPDWRQIDMDPKTFEAKLKEVAQQNPQIQGMAANLRQQIAAGVKFFGVDMASLNTGFGTNVNVIRGPLPPGVRGLDAAVADSLKELNAQPEVVKSLTHERLTRATGDRERMRFKMTMRGPTGQAVTMAVTQYILANDRDAFVVTLTTTADREANYAPVFEKIGESFRLLK